MGYRDGNLDVPDPGTGGGLNPETMTLRCHDCPQTFHGRPVVAVAKAQAHHDATGHAIAYRGTVQERWRHVAAQKGAA